MNLLFGAFLLVLIYIGSAVIVGMLGEPAFNVLHVTVIGSFYVGAVVASLLSRQLIRMDRKFPQKVGSPIAAVLLCLLFAIGSVAIGLFAAQGTLAVPIRLKAAYLLAGRYAGYWSVGLLFFVIAAMFSALAIRVLKRRQPNPSIERTFSGKPENASHLKR